MLIAVIGENCAGKSTLAGAIRSALGGEIVTGRDYLRLAKSRAEAEALDIRHGTPYVRPVNVYAGDWPDLAGAAVVLIAAGAPQQRFSRIVPAKSVGFCSAVATRETSVFLS